MYTHEHTVNNFYSVLFSSIILFLLPFPFSPIFLIYACLLLKCTFSEDNEHIDLINDLWVLA